MVHTFDNLLIAVPEPASASLALLALLGLAGVMLRRKKMCERAAHEVSGLDAVRDRTETRLARRV